MRILTDAWRYRRFIIQLFLRDFQTRYAGSLLGIFWNVIHPLMMILIYTLIFSQILKVKFAGTEGVFAYSVYLCSGIIFWNLLTETISRGSTMFIEHGLMIKKVVFPKIVIPIFIHVSAAVTLLITFLIFMLFCFEIGHPVSAYWFGRGIPAVGLFIIFSFGLALFLGTLNVFLRDIQQLVGVVLHVWFWFTPIVYVSELIPHRFQTVALLNPLVVFMTLFRRTFYENTMADFQLWILGLLYSVLSLGIGLRFFSKYQKLIVDHV